MRRLLPVVLRPSTLPLIVVALIAPSIAAFALVGPQLGLAVGALSVALLILLAARARFDEPIEVAARPDRRYRLLVVAGAPLEDPRTVEQIAAIAREGSRSTAADQDVSPEVLVLAPATSSRLARWASDVRAARAGARDSLAVSLAALAAAELDAAGRVGDSDPVQALEDELRSYPANEIAIVTGPAVGAPDVEEVRRRLDRPVRRVDPVS